MISAALYKMHSKYPMTNQTLLYILLIIFRKSITSINSSHPESPNHLHGKLLPSNFQDVMPNNAEKGTINIRGASAKNEDGRTLRIQ
jgi:hypothetical protein